MEFCYNLSESKLLKPENSTELRNYNTSFAMLQSSVSDIYNSNSHDSTLNGNNNLLQQIKNDCDNYFIETKNNDMKEIKNDLPDSIPNQLQNGVETIMRSNDRHEESNQIPPMNWSNNTMESFKEISSYNDQQLDNKFINRQDDSLHIKRPMNAFMVWSQNERKVVANEFPKMHNSDISKILGNKWKALNSEEKKPYVKMAKQLQHKHNVEHPNYKYKPRRKVKKAAKHNSINVSQFPVNTTMTNNIEKYLNGFSQLEINNSIYQASKPMLLSDNSFNQCLPNLTKLKNTDQIAQNNFMQNSYFDFNSMRVNNANGQYNQQFNATQPITISNLNQINGNNVSAMSSGNSNNFNYLPFVPVFYPQQTPPFVGQIIHPTTSINNENGNHTLANSYNDSFANLNERLGKPEEELNAMKIYTSDQMNDDAKNVLSMYHDEYSDNFIPNSTRQPSILPYINQNSIGLPCSNEIFKNFTTSYQVNGLINFQDYPHLCLNSDDNGQENNN